METTSMGVILKKLRKRKKKVFSCIHRFDGLLVHLMDLDMQQTYCTHTNKNFHTPTLTDKTHTHTAKEVQRICVLY